MMDTITNEKAINFVVDVIQKNKVVMDLLVQYAETEFDIDEDPTDIANAIVAKISKMGVDYTAKKEREKKKKAEANAKLRDAIANMITSEPVTTTEIAFALDISPQKATPIIKGLITENILNVTVTKGRKYFTKA